MKTALVRRRFDTNSGGAEKVASKFAEHFISRGHSVTVFAEEFAAEESESLKFIQVPRKGFWNSSSTMRFHKNVQNLLKEKKTDFDIVYSMCRTFPVDVFRVTEQLHFEWMKINYSAFSKMLPRHRGILNLEKKSLDNKNTRRIVTNSHLVKNQVTKTFDFPEEKIHVVRNGVDREIFYPVKSESEKLSIRTQYNLGNDCFVMLFAAGNFAIKGLKQAITVLAGLDRQKKGKNFVLLVAGGDKEAKYQQMAENFGVGDKIKFLGKCRNMRTLYAMSDILLYPSLYEPFANVCLEACACGLPVLTTILNGASEIVKHRESGYLVKDSNQIADMIKYTGELSEMSGERRTQFSKYALINSEGCCWENHVESLEKIFNEIIDEKKNNGI